jgi:hypothetical protein
VSQRAFIRSHEHRVLESQLSSSPLCTQPHNTPVEERVRVARSSEFRNRLVTPLTAMEMAPERIIPGPFPRTSRGD